MDQSEYKDQFVSEARESLDRMNTVLLQIEKHPNSKDLVDELFRLFHTLKGNSAAMGYDDFSELSHKLEDLLDAIRQGHKVVDEDIIDVLLRGCDMLDKGLASIEKDNDGNIDIKQIIPEIESMTTLDDPKSKMVEKIKQFRVSRENEENLYKIILKYEKTNSLKGAKTLLVKRNLDGDGSVLETNPSIEEIKLGRFEDTVELIFQTNKGKEETKDIVNQITGIVDVGVEDYKIKKAEKDSEGVVVQQTRSVKVNIKSLDSLMNMVGELLINKIRLEEIAKRHGDQELDTMIASLDRLIVDIQDEVMKERMIPIGNIFNRFPRMIRDLAKKQGKKVNLVIEGEDIEFDRTVLDQIGEPLVHLLRNSLDHGIELPDIREKGKKAVEGMIRLTARKDKSSAVIEISDDGKGIDVDHVKEALLRRGLVNENSLESMTKKAVLKQVFRPGFSTNEKVTQVSGRGVGMDVVENKVKALGGNVKLESNPGKGTTVVLNLPLTLAIINSLLVEVDDMRYAIPLSTINRTVNIKKDQIRTIQGNEVFLLGGSDIPLIWLSEVLHNNTEDRGLNHTVIVVEKDDNKVGLVVDDIVTQQQILIKSLDDYVKGIKGIGGATILGDGRVALILDIASILE